MFGIGDKIPDWCSIENSYRVYKGMFPENMVLLGWKNYGNLIVYDPKSKEISCMEYRKQMSDQRVSFVVRNSI